MITYEDIQKANDSISKTKIKEKDYVEVNQRIKAFRMLFPTGTIKTEILSLENGVCVIHATVGYKPDGDFNDFVVLGEGTAYEKENSTFINKTSYIENCETSAVGRALGMCGIGIDTSIASFEEVQTAIVNQESLTTEQKKALAKMMEEDNIPKSYICELYKIDNMSDLTASKFENLIANWDKLKKKYYERSNS